MVTVESTLIVLALMSAGLSSNAVVPHAASDKVDGDPVKAVRNGEIPRDGAMKVLVDPDTVISLDQQKHRVTTSQNNEPKVVHQSEAVSGTCRVTSSGLPESNSTKTTDAGSRRSSKPATKKRPADAGVELTSPGDTDGKSPRGGSMASGSVEEFRCRLCNYSGRSQHCLSKHYRAHDLAYKICRYCRRAFERPSDLLRHEERHRRRDVLGAGGSGGVDASDSTLSCSASDVVRQPAVGRIDSYADGLVASTLLVSARLGSGDNEVMLCFDEPAADALVSQPTAPPSSKLRDVYSIMAGIFVNQHLLSFNQSSPVLGGSEQAIARSAVDERTGPMVPDFGQQAFLQMLDLKVVSDSASTSPTSAAYSGGGSGQMPPRGAVAAPVRPPITPSGACRDRRRKGIPIRATSHETKDATFPIVHDGSSDVLDAAKLRCGGELDDTSPTFTACNGVIAGKAATVGLDRDCVMQDSYPRDSSSCSLSPHDKFLCRRRSRKFFSISCKICGKRHLQV